MICKRSVCHFKLSRRLVVGFRVSPNFSAGCNRHYDYCIAVQVHRYARRRDRLEFMRHRWAEQQNINLAQLNNPENATSFEKIVNGKDHNGDVENNKRLNQIFLYINQIQHLYLAYQHKMINEREFEQLAIPTLRLIAREQKLIDFILLNRGYGEHFVSKVRVLLHKLEPYKAIDWSMFSE